MESKAKESGIEIVRDVDSNIGDVYLDPKGIHRCLLSLVSNAIDACIYDEEEGKDCLPAFSAPRAQKVPASACLSPRR
jgi:nitrogen-specific signal transduction histidine kinase